MGSKVDKERVIDAMFVEKVSISMPFTALVYNGTERKIVIRGEDNLVDEITVTETAMSNWEISAPLDLAFEQHSDVEIEIPYLDMVSITLEGHVKLADDPTDVWSDQDAGM